MKKVLIIIAVLYGSYWYLMSRYQFSDLLTYAKKNPGAEWAPAVEYYVGMTYLQRTKYTQAQEAFIQLTTERSTGTYVAQGLLQLSFAAEENRDWAGARQALERLLQDFPEDKNRSLAEKRLELFKYR